MEKIKVMLVDDHAVLRMGLAALLGTRKEIDVVGEADDGNEALRKYPKLKPDVVIMDLMMPEMDGTETTRRLLADHPEAKVLILTTYGTADALGHAIEAGALGAILKTAKLPELVASVTAVAAGNRSVAPEIEQILSVDPPVQQLSKRQSEILESITRGLSNEEIATMLGISVPVVKEHIKLLFEKIGASNRAEAVAIALRKHLLKI